ncbi:MAG: UDP-N-acetylmuramoyl-L-alanine--D-glutamate ligase [Clostridia bacterium]|nr:UDP-N-acetylmuramoyl-L-alanine--D-glutamate ligase [Clostridia bacterium]
MADVIIYGKGKTGLSMAKLLQKQGKSYNFYDDKDGFSNDGSFCNATVIVSPGVHPNARGMELARDSNATVVGELEYCWELCQGKIISVTGTNGKTTTCQMIHHALKTTCNSVPLLGNGGTPFCSQVLDVSKEQYVVLESSSFMLRDANTFAPHISVFTNFAEDHLDYHGSFAHYLRAKCNNFIHQKGNDWAIFNKDDKHLVEISKLAKGKCLYYSLCDEQSNCYIKGKTIHISFENEHFCVDFSLLDKYSQHNLSNALAALLCCAVVGVDLEKAVQSLQEYTLLPHRLQQVGAVGNISFVDDSKATNVHATQSAIRCFSCPVALILGGSDKNAYFDPIFAQLPSNVVQVAVFGQTKEILQNCGKKYGVNVVVLDSLEQCVWHCYNRLLQTGGVVLMSNACASFDAFTGYEQRGQYFCKVVKQIENSV